MSNICLIDKYLITLGEDRNLLKRAKKDYVLAKKELLEHGFYVSYPRCNYSLQELDYAIKIINLKLNILNNK